MTTKVAAGERKKIALLTIKKDFHALAVRKYLHDTYDDVDCYIIENDNIATTGGLTWSAQSDFPGYLPSSDGELVKIGDLDAIWWRRVVPHEKYDLPEYITNEGHIDIIINDTHSSTLGVLLTEFKGKWISHPEPSRTAENKLVQLRAAIQAGLKIPQTLISQNPEHIRQFCAKLNNQVVVKALSGTMKGATFARMVEDRLLASDESLKLCPTIYQEYVTGTQHLRVNCFGRDVRAAMIETEVLDWRGQLESKMGEVELPADLKEKLLKVLDLLGLEMGIFDLKINAEGEPVWLEINPQGQFLFLEGLIDMPLTAAFGDYLYREASANRQAQAGVRVAA